MGCQNYLFSITVLSLLLVLLIGLGHDTIVNAQDNEEPLVIEAGNYRLQINDLWLADQAGGKMPSHGTYLVMDITLFNDSSSSMCFRDRHFTAKIPGLEDQTPEDLSEVRDEFFQDRDYPGGFLGQCLDAGESELSLLEYDVPADIETITLRFAPKEEGAETTLVLPRRAAKLGDGLIGLRLRLGEPAAEETEEQQAAHQQISPTTAPSPTARPSATPLREFTATPRVVTSTPRPTATTVIVTRYISATGNVNVRSCASTDCQILTVLPPGSAIDVLSSEDGWHEIVLAAGGAGFVADFLTSASRPAAVPQQAAPRQPMQAPAQPRSNADAPAQQGAIPQQPAPEQPISVPPPAPAFACDCSRTCEAMVSCEEAYFQLSCGCSRRDGDSDGVPCENICPGG